MAAVFLVGRIAGILARFGPFEKTEQKTQKTQKGEKDAKEPELVQVGAGGLTAV